MRAHRSIVVHCHKGIPLAVASSGGISPRSRHLRTVIFGRFNRAAMSASPTGSNGTLISYRDKKSLAPVIASGYDDPMTNSSTHRNNRHAMAQRLADFLAACPLTTAATVALLGPANRRQVERMAGERHAASDETWAMVVENLRRWESRRGELALRYIDDERFVPAGAAA